MKTIPLIAAVAAASAFLSATPAEAALPAVQITRVYYDSPGSDRRSNASLNGEYVVIHNTTRRAIDLEGWQVRDKTGYSYEFGPDVILGANKKITLRTGSGSDGASTLHWGRRQYVWNNDKDTAYVRKPDGRLVDSCAYNSSRYDYKNCQ
ncbi:lamin tail domain-containing protein [Nonomuraea sp. NPDC050310]|uniref:lamin tail domain-containing protein n=1 Tax=Nonomuraea sp. NPDC050310 TaxID=3154935 RepID=UPI00340E6437